MIFPLAVTMVSIAINGTRVQSYRAAYLARGRVMAPIEPYLTMVAASVERRGTNVLARRGDRFSQCQERNGYVPLGLLLRSLGVQLLYDPATRVLSIRTPRTPLETATPFNPAVPRVPPVSIFTPPPQSTPRPVVSGKPVPRRTPLPVELTPAPAPSPRA